MAKDAKKIIKIASLSILFVFIVGYAFFRSYNLIVGVRIKNVTINDTVAKSGITIQNSVLKIAGNAKNAAKLSLNGREISLDQYGNFEETIVLLSGYNIVDITALDKFGHSDEKIYQLMHSE